MHVLRRTVSFTPTCFDSKDSRDRPHAKTRLDQTRSASQAHIPPHLLRLLRLELRLAPQPLLLQLHVLPRRLQVLLEKLGPPGVFCFSMKFFEFIINTHRYVGGMEIFSSCKAIHVINSP